MRKRGRVRKGERDKTGGENEATEYEGVCRRVKEYKKEKNEEAIEK